MPYESKYFTLGIYLYEPQEEGDIVSCVESVPECTDHEYPELGDSPAFEWRPLVDTFPEPFLNCDVPMWDFGADVLVCLYRERTAGADKIELLPVETDPAGMYRSNAEFPPEIVLEPDESHADWGIEKDEEATPLIELVSLHVGHRCYHLPHNKDPCASDRVPHWLHDLPGSVWDLVVGFLELHELLVLLEFERGTDQGCGQEVQEADVVEERDVMGDPVGFLLLSQLVLGCISVLDGICQQRVLAHQDHQQGGGIHRPASVVID